VEIDVPFPPGARLRVLVVGGTPDDDLDGLLAAAQSSTGFWDNPFDDEDWNDA
jgi:hypothetical protein